MLLVVLGCFPTVRVVVVILMGRPMILLLEHRPSKIWVSFCACIMRIPLFRFPGSPFSSGPRGDPAGISVSLVFFFSPSAQSLQITRMVSWRAPRTGFMCLYCLIGASVLRILTPSPKLTCLLLNEDVYICRLDSAGASSLVRAVDLIDTDDRQIRRPARNGLGAPPRVLLNLGG